MRFNYIILKVTLAVLVVGLAAGCASKDTLRSGDRALYHLKIGIAHLQKGNYPLALSELLKAEKLDSSNEQIHNNLAIAYFVRKKFLRAERHARIAINLNPKYTEARNNLGRILLEQGATKEAIKVLETATEDLTFQFPERSLSNLGIAYFRDEKFDRALGNLQRSLELRDTHCLTSNYFGRTLFELKKFKQAAIAFDRSIRLCKSDKFDEPIYYGAVSYYKIGQPEESIARLEDLIKRFPEGPNVDKAKGMLDIIR